jgi:hypothetical protein
MKKEPTPPSAAELLPADSRAPQRISPLDQVLLFPEPENHETSIGFTTRLLVATTLPHSRPDDNEFTRSSGLYDLCVLTPRRIGLPYGRYPRLALVWIITEAVCRRTPLLYLPRSLSSFAQQLGITPSSGPKGTLVQLREQLHRLVNATFSCLGTGAAESGSGPGPAFYEGGGIHPIKRYLLWWDEPSPSAESPPFLLLNDDFFQELLAHPIPISLDALRSLRSPLEMDVYMWLTWRSFRSLRLQRPEPISWRALQNQFGADYREEKAFRFNFLRALKRILKVYPAIRLKPTRRGLILHPYPPHVPRRPLPPTPPKEL